MSMLVDKEHLFITKKIDRRFDDHNNNNDEGETVFSLYSFFDRPCCPI